jgi:YD repeat-containing protein
LAGRTGLEPATSDVTRPAFSFSIPSHDPVGNRLSSVSAPIWTYNAQNQLLSQNGAIYTYDADGNLAQKVDFSGTWTYTWNADNQLTAVARNGTLSASFLYDPLVVSVSGKRVIGGTELCRLQGTSLLPFPAAARSPRRRFRTAHRTRSCTTSRTRAAAPARA